MSAEFNNRIRQVLLLLVLTGLALLLFFELYIFFPGFLGAITIYILSRDYYARLVTKENGGVAQRRFYSCCCFCCAWACLCTWR
jgi:hypothetical protein